MKIYKSIMAAVVFFPFAAIAAEHSPTTLPEKIACTFPGSSVLPEGKIVFYLSGFTEEGHSLYQTFGAQTVSILFLPDGTQEPVDSRVCGGKSLNELIEEGATF